MPPRSFSAAKLLTGTMRAYQRNYSSRKLMEKSYENFTLGAFPKGKRTWPLREESYAAAQVMRQNRNSINIRKFGHQIVMKRGVTPKRNNILTARSAFSKRRTVQEIQERQKSDKSTIVDSEEGDMEAGADNKEKDEGNFVRDVVFGRTDDDDDMAKQREADDELLMRITKHRPVYPQSMLSKKVTAPYSTYKTHRSTWAEFRHRMIYGGTNY